MSATRHERRGSRAAQALPYSRPAKKSPWSLSNLLSFLNPLRFRSSSEELDSEESSERSSLSSDSTEAADTNKTTELLYSNSQHDATMQFHASRPADSSQDQHIQAPIAKSSPSKRSALHLDDDSSPAKNLEIVTKFLEERGGKPMSSVELEGVISLIRKSKPSENREPFRFSCSTFPTPGRDDLPDAMRGRSPIGNGNAQGPRKMLTKNPNGVYRWRGGGSAKPARSRNNRYASPTFGLPRITPERLTLKESAATGEGARTANKRRRIGDEASFSVASSSVTSTNDPTITEIPDSSKSAQPLFSTLHPTASPKPGNGASGQVIANGGPNGTSFRFRSSGLQKPTTPAVPSPLRQAWSGSTSDISTSSVPKPTKAANFMAELIKEVTPPKPDVSNPYQTANSVKVCPSRPRPKRTRATEKPRAPASSNATSDAEAKADESGLEKNTPQAIIEATLPKGSKRARPPAHFEKAMATETATTSVEIIVKGATEESMPPSAPKEARNNVIYTIEEVDEEVNERVTKKARSSLERDEATPVERSAPPLVEEIKDVKMSYVNDKLPPSIGTVSTALPRNVLGHKPMSAPKEPSKLRYSYQPEAAPSLTSPASPPATLSKPAARAAEVSTKRAVALTQDPKTTVLALPTSALHVFTFTFGAISTVTVSPDEKLARGQVISKVEASLPTFTFHPKPKVSSSVITVTSPPAKAFDWSAIGINPPAPISGDWTCSICMLTNPASATDKCTICETPR